MVHCQTAPLNNRLNLRTTDQLAGLDEYFARKFNEESSPANSDRDARYLNEEQMAATNTRSGTSAVDQMHSTCGKHGTHFHLRLYH